jgi:hypothetical protein
MHLCWSVPIRMKLGAAAAITVAAFMAACGGTTTTTVSEVAAGPDAVRCLTSVAPPGTIPHSGSRVNLTVVAARECSWNARSESDWVGVEPATGQGQGTIVVNVATNPAASTRSGTIVVNDTRLSVTQEPAPCTFRLGSPSAQISFDGGRASVSVTTPGGCAWRASSNAQAWARVLTDSGTGSGTVEIEVAPNTGSERSTTIAIADQSFTLLQTARPPELPPSAGPPPAGGGGGSGSGGGGSGGQGGGGSGGGGGGNGGGGGGGGGGGNEPRIDLSGAALFVEGSCPSIGFLLEFRRVFTTGDTKFRSGSCSDIRFGTSVEVEGRVQSDGRVRATDIRIR